VSRNLTIHYWKWRCKKTTKYPLNRDLLIAIWLILWLLLIYSIYYQFRKATINERGVAIKLTAYSLICLYIIYLLLIYKLEVYIITSEKYVIGLMWTLIVSLIIYMYLNIIGVIKMKGSNQTEIAIIFFLLYMSIAGFGYFGIRVIIHTKYLFYEVFQTNSYHGVRFLAFNVWFLLLIYFISFFTEREV